MMEEPTGMTAAVYASAPLHPLPLPNLLTRCCCRWLLLRCHSRLPPVSEQRGTDEHAACRQQRDAAPAEERLPLRGHRRDFVDVDFLVPVLPGKVRGQGEGGIVMRGWEATIRAAS